MDNIKTVLLITGGSILLVMLMIFGLSRMSTGQEVGSTKLDETILLDGAKLSTSSGEVKVTVVNFSDMECPACRSAHEIIGELERTEGVRYVLRYFPLPIHKNAVISAKSVEAARQMGMGWEMVNLLFEKQPEWSAERDTEERLRSYAVELGLNEEEFWQRVNSDETGQVVATDNALASRLQLSGTPTIYINGEQTAPQFVMGRVKELLAR